MLQDIELSNGRPEPPRSTSPRSRRLHFAPDLPASEVALEDQRIDPRAQAMMAAHAGARVTNVKGSHVSMLSHPEEVAAAILDAAVAADAGPKS